MAPVSIRKLAQLCRARNLEWSGQAEADKLKILVTELRDSADIIADTIKQIEAKT